MGRPLDSASLAARLRPLWEEELALPVEVGDDFFRLGGQSITAVRLARRLEEALGLTVPVSAILRWPTVTDLAEALAVGLPPGLAGPVAAVGSGEVPLSRGQEQIWAIERAVPGAAFFTELVRIGFRGALDRRALTLALAEVVKRHEVLRTRLSPGPGGCVGAVSPNIEIDLREVECNEEEARRISAERRREPFDLATEPPLRALLASCGKDFHLLLVELHHIAFDGSSRDVLVRELATLYSAFAGAPSAPLAPLPMQYGDFARWQRSHFSGEVRDHQMGFWRKQLADPGEPMQLWGEAGDDVYRTRRSPFELSAATTAGLRDLGRAAGATLFMSLLAGFATFVFARSREEDVPVATLVANRGWAATQPLIGLFANTLVLRLRIGSGETFRTLLEAARAVALDAYRHEGLPFEDVLAELRRDGVDTRRLLQLGLALHPPHSAALPVPGGTISVLHQERDAAGAEALDPSTFDLTLELREVGGGLRGRLEYKSGLVGNGEGLAAELDRVLTRVCARPDFPLSQLV